MFEWANCTNPVDLRISCILQNVALLLTFCTQEAWYVPTSLVQCSFWATPDKIGSLFSAIGMASHSQLSKFSQCSTYSQLSYLKGYSLTWHFCILQKNSLEIGWCIRRLQHGHTVTSGKLQCSFFAYYIFYWRVLLEWPYSVYWISCNSRKPLEAGKFARD